MNIDCMEYMATQPDEAFDLAIVDPPYGIGVGLHEIKEEELSKNLIKKGKTEKW